MSGSATSAGNKRSDETASIELLSFDSTLQDRIRSAQSNVNQSHTIVAIKSESFVVLGIDSSKLLKLQEISSIAWRTVLINKTLVTYAGIPAEAEMLLDKVTSDIESRLGFTGKEASAEFVARSISNLQREARLNSNRIYSAAFIIAGYDQETNSPSLYSTDPCGTFSSFKCTTLGYGSNTARQKLEQSVEIDTDLTEEAAIDLTILCLWKACKSSSFDLVVVKSSGEIEKIDLDSERVAGYLEELKVLQSNSTNKCTLLSRYPLTSMIVGTCLCLFLLAFLIASFPSVRA